MTDTDLALANFTFSKRLIFREPQETQRNAHHQNKSFSVASLVPPPRKKTPKPVKIKKENDVTETPTEKPSRRSLGVRKGMRSEMNKEVVGSIDDDINQLGSLSGTQDKPNSLLKKTTTIIKQEPFPLILAEDTNSKEGKEEPKEMNEVAKKAKSRRKVSKEVVKKGVSSVNNVLSCTQAPIDYMSQVDQLVASDIPYEDKLAAVRNLAKHSLTGFINQNKVVRSGVEEVGRSGVEEVGKVFQESEVYAGSECSLFSDDDEAYDANGGAMDDGQKSQVVECGQEKDKNISPSKKKRKVDQEDDEIQKDDVKEGRIKIQKRDESNSEVIDHEKNKKNIKRRKSEQVVTNGDEEESQEGLNRL